MNAKREKIAASSKREFVQNCIAVIARKRMNRNIGDDLEMENNGTTCTQSTLSVQESADNNCEDGGCQDEDTSCIAIAGRAKVEKPAAAPDRISVAEILNGTSSSLQNIRAYESDSPTDEDEAEEDEPEEEEEEDDDDNTDYDEIGDAEVHQKAAQRPPKDAEVWSRNRPRSATLQDTLRKLDGLNLDDLPPVVRSDVFMPPDACDRIGQVTSIIDKLVMVETIPNKPAYDIDSLLFLKEGKQVLGYIFDVLGPVSHPLYAVRFNSPQDIVELNVQIGMPVFAAPQTEHSHFVFVNKLMKDKGSDASWKNDTEVPHEFQDYSDDENEYNLIGSRKRHSHERHLQFEKDMNIRNAINTRYHRIRETAMKKMKKLPGASSRATFRGQQQQQRPPLLPTPPTAFTPPMSTSVRMQMSQSGAALSLASPDVVNIYANPLAAPGVLSQAKPHVQGPFYPPDMGLPPPSVNAHSVPNAQYYNHQVRPGFGPDATLPVRNPSDMPTSPTFHRMRHK